MTEATRHNDRARGFSLIELLVAVAILGILMSLGYSALSRGKTVSKDTVCRNNLKQIALGLNLYYNAHGAYPTEDLPASLERYVGSSPALFVCPCDPDAQGDSYSEFYVCRNDLSTQDYVCGCPRHVDERSAITLFSSSSAQLLKACAVQWNGQAIAPGTEVGTGAMTFADGSQVTVPSDMVVRLIQSFQMRDGRMYNLVGVDVNETGTLDIKVTPGSRFEVVTPAAIAGVQGTRFQVECYFEDDEYRVKVSVSEGEVQVRDRWQDEAERLLVAGQQRLVTLPRAKIPQLLPRRWVWRRKQLLDDSRFEHPLTKLIEVLRQLEAAQCSSTTADQTADTAATTNRKRRWRRHWWK